MHSYFVGYRYTLLGCIIIFLQLVTPTVLCMRHYIELVFNIRRMRKAEVNVLMACVQQEDPLTVTTRRIYWYKQCLCWSILPLVV